MRKSLIICGPPACGKTTNAEKLQEKFSLEKIVDEFIPSDLLEPTGVLYLTTQTCSQVSAWLQKQRLTNLIDVLPFEMVRL